jgi:hypothetical protein
MTVYLFFRKLLSLREFHLGENETTQAETCAIKAHIFLSF